MVSNKIEGEADIHDCPLTSVCGIQYSDVRTRTRQGFSFSYIHSGVMADPRTQFSAFICHNLLLPPERVENASIFNHPVSRFSSSFYHIYVPPKNNAGSFLPFKITYLDLTMLFMSFSICLAHSLL